MRGLIFTKNCNLVKLRLFVAYQGFTSYNTQVTHYAFELVIQQTFFSIFEVLATLQKPWKTKAFDWQLAFPRLEVFSLDAIKRLSKRSTYAMYGRYFMYLTAYTVVFTSELLNHHTHYCN